ncbi:MAG: hypothetical protein ACXIUM_12870 [Wenzhouxiangella sp.]
MVESACESAGLSLPRVKAARAYQIAEIWDRKFFRVLELELDVLNRAALLLRCKEPFVRWINEADPNPSGFTVSLEEVNLERTVYLISDEDADSSDLVRRWVEANFLLLFESELEAWYTDPDLWPSPLTLELFDQWFSVECHSVIFDTVGGAIVDDET